MTGVRHAEAPARERARSVQRPGVASRLGLGLEAALAFAGPAAAGPGRGDRGGPSGRDRLARVADRRLAVEEVADLVAREGLVFEKAARQGLEGGLLLDEDALRFAQALLDEAAHLGIDLLGRRLGDVLLPGDRHAEEDLVLVLAIGDGAELGREAPARHHHAGEPRRLVDVGLGPGGDLVGAE